MSRSVRVPATKFVRRSWDHIRQARLINGQPYPLSSQADLVISVVVPMLPFVIVIWRSFGHHQRGVRLETGGKRVRTSRWIAIERRRRFRQGLSSTTASRSQTYSPPPIYALERAAESEGRAAASGDARWGV